MREAAAESPTPWCCNDSQQQHATVRSYLAAGAGLAVGALIGSYSALHGKRTAKPRSRDIASARLNDRIRRVEHKIGHVSRIKRLVEQENVIDRIKQVENEIRDAARNARRARRRKGHSSWMDRTVQKVKDYF